MAKMTRKIDAINTPKMALDGNVSVSNSIMSPIWPYNYTSKVTHDDDDEKVYCIVLLPITDPEKPRKA